LSGGSRHSDGEVGGETLLLCTPQKLIYNVKTLELELTMALRGHKIDHNSDQNPFGDPMKTMPLSEVKTKLSELVDAVERRDEVVSITRNGKPVAMIVIKEEYESWRETMDIMSDAKLMREIRKGIQSLKRAKKRYTLDELFAD